jgi:hypothetical protein
VDGACGAVDKPDESAARYAGRVRVVCARRDRRGRRRRLRRGPRLRCVPRLEPVRAVRARLRLGRARLTCARARRSAVLTDAAFVPLPTDEQTVAENKRAIFVVQIPPLAGPISAGTPPDPLNTQVSLENVTHLEPALRRVAWAYAAVPALAISAERWSAVSVIADGPQAGLALYESREVYAGALAPAVEALYGTGLQEAYDAQAAALKQLLEG